MKLPKLKVIAQSRQPVTVFGGLNHNPVIGDGEWYDMKNMTADHYPLLAPDMDGREEFFDFGIEGMASNNGLCYIKRTSGGTAFVIVKMRVNGSREEHTLPMELAPGEKKLVSMGAYVIILPDKKWVNTADHTYGDIEAEYTGEIWYAVCNKEGQAFKFEASATRPESPLDGAYWVDTMTSPPTLKRWYEASKMWVVETSYLRIWIDSDVFDEGDTLQGEELISEIEEKGTVYIPKDPTIEKVLNAYGNRYLVIKGVATYGEDPSVAGGAINSTRAGDITWSRKMPDLDYMIESGNRLWGCKYGSTDKGFLNEIYASKLGDFKNWNSFQGVSTDSYVASIGADGPFTGAINYNGKPVFFKEDCMIQVYGAYPAQYQVSTVTCNGIQPRCAESAAIVNNRLYYWSRNGVCMYDGSLPVTISAPLGRMYVSTATGGGDVDKYYVQLNTESDENSGCYVFDTKTGLWHKRDNRLTYYSKGCEHDGDLYMFYRTEYDDDPPTYSSNVYRIRGAGIPVGGTATAEGPVEWMVESGEIGLTTPDAKYISRLDVRMSLAEGSEVSFFVKYDFEEEWLHLATIPGTNLRSFHVPIRPKRCDTMRLRIEGIGDCRIYSITKTIEQGGEVH